MVIVVMERIMVSSSGNISIDSNTNTNTNTNTNNTYVNYLIHKNHQVHTDSIDLTILTYNTMHHILLMIIQITQHTYIVDLIF